MLKVENINYQHKSFKILDTISFDAKAGKGVRVGTKIENGKKVRVSKKTGEII